MNNKLIIKIVIVVVGSVLLTLLSSYLDIEMNKGKYGRLGGFVLFTAIYGMGCIMGMVSATSDSGLKNISPAPRRKE